MPGLLIRAAEVAGEPADVRIVDGRVAALGRGLALEAGEALLDAAGGALLPGLHDHHLHLLAWARAEGSLACGPPSVRDGPALAAALWAARGRSGWVRGVGYHESVAGALDRDRLDALLPGVALRIQHRTGALWMLSSEACRRLGLDAGVDAPGVERDATRRATGRLFRLDAWLRERIGPEPLPPLAPLGVRLARCGVTGVTDATPDLGAGALAALGEAVACGALAQRIVLLGTETSVPSWCTPGPRKLVLDERALPVLDDLVARLRGAHAEGRALAVHCVTRAELVLALAAFEEAGVRTGDRIEHASVTPPDALAWLARLGLAVVTQPGFVRTRGDDYLHEVEPTDRPWLYRCASFDAAGVALGAGTDAPFGDPDPWLAMQAAVDRRTSAGEWLVREEALSPERALALFTTAAEAPGGAPRRIEAGAPADLCLLDRPWARARGVLASSAVAATIRAGRTIWRRP